MALLYFDIDENRAEDLLIKISRTRDVGGDFSNAETFNNLAYLYYSQGKHLEAEYFYRKSFRDSLKAFGDRSYRTLGVQLNLVANHIALNQISQAYKHLRNIEPKLKSHTISQLLTTRKDRIRRKFVFNVSFFQDIVFTLALKSKSLEIQKFAANVLLGWKNTQSDLDSHITHLVQHSEDDALKLIWEDVQLLRKKISHISKGSYSYELHPDVLLQQLEKAEFKLRNYFSELNSSFHLQDINVEQVYQELPPDTVLIDFKQYREINLKTGKSEGLRWLALFISANDKSSLRLFDAGSVNKTKELVQKLHSRNYNEREGVAQKLYQQLFGQLDSLLIPFKAVYLAPDSILNLIPFDSLKLPDNSYWIEQQEIRILHTGRDLKPSYENPETSGMIAIGNVDYDRFGSNKLALASSSSISNIPSNASNTIRDFKPIYFSKEEIERISSMYRLSKREPIKLWTGKDATEGRLKSLKSAPSVLHLATHGFYLPQSPQKNSFLDWYSEQPLVRSGLSLAGSNRGLKGEVSITGEDGILYSLEILGLNLQGTQLVVLSACETGQGVPDYSGGVFGLVRSFRIAGARSILVTLWPVKDRDAKDFMTTFYRNWLERFPETPSRALRATKLAFLNSTNPTHRDPKVWSPYVLVGIK